MIKVFYNKQAHAFTRPRKEIHTYPYTVHRIKEKVWEDNHHRFYYGNEFLCDVISDELILTRVMNGIFYVIDSHGQAYFKMMLRGEIN